MLLRVFARADAAVLLCRRMGLKPVQMLQEEDGGLTSERGQIIPHIKG